MGGGRNPVQGAIQNKAGQSRGPVGTSARSEYVTTKGNLVEIMPRTGFIQRSASSNQVSVDHWAFVGKTATALWNGLGDSLLSDVKGLKDLPIAHGTTGVVSGIASAVHPNSNVADRIMGGSEAAAAFASKYAYVAQKVGAATMAKWLGAFSGVIGFAATAYEILTMMGKGYAAGHQIASANGKRSGALVGLAAGALRAGRADASQHIYHRVSRDMFPGSFEVSYAKSFNQGFYEGYSKFMSLPDDVRVTYILGLTDMIKNNVLQDNALRRLVKHHAEFGDEAQATQTNIILPYVVHSLKIAALAQKQK